MLRSRLLTALALSALLAFALFQNDAGIASAVLGLFVFAGAWEWAQFCGARSIPARLAFVLLVAVIAIYCRIRLWSPASFNALMVAAAAWWCLAFFYLLAIPSRIPPALALLAGLMALVPTWLALVRIGTSWPRGAEWALFILALPVAVDTGGFFAGHWLGRLRLAPTISPNKTWEGFVGGMLLALLLALLGSWWFAQPAAVLVPLCLAAAVLSVVGDLSESLLKRANGMKDSGRMFPGHGGALDRIDSVMAATPVMALGLIWMGVGA
jgi:phosphatidate cytidylyltransferase